jgi:hypothetical protein
MSAFFVSPIFRFSAFFVVNHVPDTAFPTWILLHFSFEKKLKIATSYLWDPCCTQAPRVSDYVSIQSTPICVCYIIHTSHETLSYELTIFAWLSTVMTLR